MACTVGEITIYDTVLSSQQASLVYSSASSKYPGTKQLIHAVG